MTRSVTAAFSDGTRFGACGSALFLSALCSLCRDAWVQCWTGMCWFWLERRFERVLCVTEHDAVSHSRFFRWNTVWCVWQCVVSVRVMLFVQRCMGAVLDRHVLVLAGET